LVAAGAGRDILTPIEAVMAIIAVLRALGRW
jgi:hypothetical protein